MTWDAAWRLSRLIAVGLFMGLYVVGASGLVAWIAIMVLVTTGMPWAAGACAFAAAALAFGQVRPLGARVAAAAGLLGP